METYEIISPLSVKQWKKAWNGAVVEDSRENRKNYHQKTCYCGHFTSDNEFILYYHKEFENYSLNTNFFGRLEKHGRGCRLTGHFAKKRTANIFLVFASALTAVTTIVMGFSGQFKMMCAPAVLCVILLLCLFIIPKGTQDILVNVLKEISFPDDKNDNERTEVL